MTRARINPGAVRARLALIMDDVIGELGTHGEVLIRVNRHGDLTIDRAGDTDDG